MAPWLKDEDGNDVFDSVNSPLSGDPIFDPIDTTETFGDNPLTRTVDTTDDGLRTLSASTPGGITAGSGIDAIRESADVNVGTTMNWKQALNVAGGNDPNDADAPGMGWTKALLVVAVVGAALWLLRPVLGIAENLTE